MSFNNNLSELIIVFPEYPFKNNYFLTSNNVRMHYVDEGEGPVVVMVHGNPTWSYFFRNLIQVLQSKFRVIAVDHIGCGLSDKPQQYSYSLAQHIDNLTQLLNHLGISKCSLVMHDWGGSIGSGYAVRHPDKIDKIVAMNTAAFRSQRIPFRINICRIPVIGEFIVRGLNGFAWPATFMAVTNPLKKEIARAYLKPYSNWQNRIAIARFVQDIPMNQGHTSYDTLVSVENGLQLLADHNIPLMLVWGGADFCFNKSFYDEWLRRFPNARAHYFADAGHYILEDKRDEVNSLISDFL